MKRNWWDKEFKILVTIGESTTAGGGASCREHGWPNRLAAMINDFQRIPVHLVNVGIGANVISTSSPSYVSPNSPVAMRSAPKRVPDLSHCTLPADDSVISRSPW